jgi:hypothetical protein
MISMAVDRLWVERPITLRLASGLLVSDLADFNLPARSVQPASLGGLKGEHPLHVPGHGHKASLAAHLVEPAEQKLSESSAPT